MHTQNQKPKKKPPIDENNLTPRQVCDILQIGRSTLHGWLKAGQVPGAFRVGSRIRIPYESMAALKKPIASLIPETPNILQDSAA